MNIDSLRKAIARVDSVAPHAEFILSLAKPCVGIQLTEGAAKDSGSRFGGHPYVPSGFCWPTHSIGEYWFLGQFNFAEIVDRPQSLPDTGLLSLFYAYDEEGEIFWGDDGYVLGFYWPTYDQHVLIKSPNEEAPDAIKIEMTGGIDIPRHDELRNDWPFDSNTLYELTDKLVDSLDLNSEYLLGYPSFSSLAYDPTPKGDWISLLTVYSLDEFDWCWHDGDRLMVFIEPEKLAKRDFSDLKCDAG